MTDVRDAAASATATRSRAEPRGDFIWYELLTPDPKEAKAFYDAVVGWDIEPEPSGDLDYRMVRRSDGGNAGGVMRLTDEMAAQGARPTWLGYINVADVDATVASTASSGGKVLLPAFDIPGIGRIAMVTDPQGAPFYVMKPIPPEGREDEQSDVSSPDAEQRVGWNELSTSDPAGARRFYTDQFGWGSDEFMDMGEMGEYRFLEKDGTRIGALCGTMPGQDSKWRYYFRVPSITAAKKAAEEGGGSIRMGPHQVPTGEWIVIGSDPQGAEFTLVGGQ